MKQVSIFAENKKGTMQRLTEVLYRNEINILGSVTNDSAEYGIVRMVVSDPDLAMEVLTAEGYLVKLTEVIGVDIDDVPGALNSLLHVVNESNINVNYLYLSFGRENARPIIILHTDDVMEVKACLSGKGFHIL